MSLKTENSRRVAKSRPVCMDLKTMKKRHYLQVLFATLQSGSVQYVLNILFTFSITLLIRDLSPSGIAILLLLDF